MTPKRRPAKRPHTRSGKKPGEAAPAALDAAVAGVDQHMKELDAACASAKRRGAALNRRTHGKYFALLEFRHRVWELWRLQPRDWSSERLGMSNEEEAGAAAKKKEREWEPFLEMVPRVIEARKQLFGTGYDVPAAWQRANIEIGFDRAETYKGTRGGAPFWHWHLHMEGPKDREGLGRLVREVEDALERMENAPAGGSPPPVMAAADGKAALDGAEQASLKPQRAEHRCPAMKKTEIVRRLLDNPSKAIRSRDQKTKMNKCGLRSEGNGRWTIRLDPAFLSQGEIDRLKMSQGPLLLT